MSDAPPPHADLLPRPSEPAPEPPPAAAAGPRPAPVQPEHPDGLPTGHPDSLAANLEPALRRATGGRLSAVAWFRSRWQRGGGSTGLATFATDQGDAPVVVKLPVGPTERRWTTALGQPAAAGDDHAPTPKVYASGDTINGYDLGWLVLERLPGSPLGADLDESAVRGLLRATAEWYRRAAAVASPLPAGPPAGPAPAGPDYERLIGKARDAAKHGEFPDAQRWNQALKAVSRALPVLLRRWNSRPINCWCHGDLHPGNAMRRAAPPASREPAPCVLIDFALVHPGHWVEDALYLERVHWGRPAALCGVNCVSTLAAFRRELGLPADGDYGALANTKRVLAAAAAPSLLGREGNPKYMAHALDLLGRLLPMVAH